MRVAITGAGGQVGRALQHVAPEFGAVPMPLTSADLDVSDARAVSAILHDLRPDCIIHAAAMTDTDGCETQADRAYAVNALGAGYVAEAARRVGCPMIAVSTNYVFDGERDAPYDEFDQPNPLSVYARSKYAGELAAVRTGAQVMIVRTSMVYAEEGKNFLQTMLALAARGIPLKVVSDQWGQPTYATDLARGLMALMQRPIPGTYHLTNTGRASWADWAFTAWDLAGRTVEATRVAAVEFPRLCIPPTNGVLANRAAAALGISLPSWQDGVQRCLASMGQLGS